MNNNDVQKTVDPTNVDTNISTTDVPKTTHHNQHPHHKSASHVEEVKDEASNAPKVEESKAPVNDTDVESKVDQPVDVKDDPKVKKDVDDTMQAMNDKILVLESYQDDGSTPAVKQQVDNLIEDVISFLNNMKEQAQNVYNNAKDSNQAMDALAYINKTADSVYNEARLAITDLKENPQLVDNYTKMKSQFDAGVHKLNEKVDGVIIELRKNDNFMQAVNTIETKTNEIVGKTIHSINEFAQREDVQTTIDKAKDATIDVSQKAADLGQRAADAIRKALKKSD